MICRKAGYCKTGQWKLSLYGNRGKTKDVFPPFPQRLENSPGMDEFSTVTTAPTTGTKREQKQVPRKTVYTKDLTPPADDFVVMARYQGTRLREDIEGFIEGRMGLTINREKTRIVNLGEEGATLDFLGFTFRYDRDRYGSDRRYLNIVPSAKSVTNQRSKLRKLTDSHQCFTPLHGMIKKINQQTTGWTGYFDFGYPRQAFRDINHFTTERLIKHTQRRSQRAMKLGKGDTYTELFRRLGLKALWCLRQEFSGKPDAGNPHVRFDEGGGS